MGGARFKSRAGQIEHSVANGSPPQRHFFEKSCVVRRRNDTKLGLANSLHVTVYYSECNDRFDLTYHFCVILLTCHIFKILYLQVSFSRNFENLNDFITYNESSRYVFQIGNFYLDCSASPLYSVLFFSLFIFLWV